MSILDRWPSTPVKLITAWAFSVIFFIASLVVMLFNLSVNEQIFYTLAGVIFGSDAVAAYQFKAKRATAWAPPVTESEVVKPAASGQPAPVDPKAPAVAGAKALAAKPSPTDTLGEEGV